MNRQAPMLAEADLWHARWMRLLRLAHNNSVERPGAWGSVTVDMMARVESEIPHSKPPLEDRTPF